MTPSRKSLYRRTVPFLLPLCSLLLILFANRPVHAHTDVAPTPFFVVTTPSGPLSFDVCTGLGSENDVVEEKTAYQILQIPGQLHWGDVMCARKVSADLSLEFWRSLVEIGQIDQAKLTVNVTRQDTSGKVQARWQLSNAWPSSLFISGVTAGGPLEVLILTSEAIVRQSDVIPPVITLNGANPMTLEAGTPYVEPGATALDDVSGPVPVTISGTVNTKVVATYTITYTASDAAGNVAILTRTVNVVDTTAPSITAPAPVAVTATSSLGAVVNYGSPTATDNVGVVSSGCAPPSGSLFPLGTTTVTCWASDAAGNTSTATTTVTVNPGAPRIAGSVAGKGWQSTGVLYVDVKLANTGTGLAGNTNVANLTLRTLAGSGVVTVSASSPPLPLALGNLAAGSSVTVRLFLLVPATVTKFSITETGTLQDWSGTAVGFSTAEVVYP